MIRAASVPGLPYRGTVTISAEYLTDALAAKGLELQEEIIDRARDGD